jgi:hypothetical protein
MTDAMYSAIQAAYHQGRRPVRFYIGSVGWRLLLREHGVRADRGSIAYIHGTEPTIWGIPTTVDESTGPGWGLVCK